MQQPYARSCPSWCVADHTVEDEGSRPRHRGTTVVVPGIAIRPEPPYDAHGVELLIELHASEGDPAVAVYIGDGVHGIDLSTETATRLVRRLAETLREAGVTAM